VSATGAAARWKIGKAAALPYDRRLVPVLFGPWAEEIVKRTGIGEGQQVLDVACGTGAVAFEAARAVGRSGAICGLDRNEAMLQRARSRSRKSRLSVRWHCGDAEALPFRPRRFDAVLCQHGVQFFSDRKRGVQEMVRVLRPGGRVAVSVWGPLDNNPWAAAIVAAFDAVLPAWALSMQMPFSMADGKELESLLASECTKLRLNRVRRKLTIPDTGAFVHDFLAALPFRDQIEAHASDLADAILTSLDRPRKGPALTLGSEVWIANGVA
jgi:SAM-dependent methyltransferase